jgi:hypothetical protein
MLPVLTSVVSLAAAPDRCVPVPFSRLLRAELVQALTPPGIDGGQPPRAVPRDDAALLKAVLRLEPPLPFWTFALLAHQLPDECVREGLGPALERHAQTCRGDECTSLNGLIFRREVVRAIERDILDGGEFELLYRAALRVTPVDDGGVHIQVGARLDDGGWRLHGEDVRVDPAAAVMLERGMLDVPVIDAEAHTTFGLAGDAATWLTSEPLGPNAALVACTNGNLLPLGRFLRVRVVWQHFPAGWTQQFEYALPCAGTFVVPTTQGVRPGRWRTFSLGPSAPETEGDPGPPWVNGSRVRALGPVTYRETMTSNEITIYGKRCTLEATVGGARRTAELSSAYGCQLEWAADVNRDGLADVVVRMGHESCEFSHLFLSGPSGWTDVARVGGCE